MGLTIFYLLLMFAIICIGNIAYEMIKERKRREIINMFYKADIDEINQHMAFRLRLDEAIEKENDRIERSVIRKDFMKKSQY